MTIASRDTGQVLQTWVGPKLARELKELADADRRSVSSLIRIAVEDKLREAEGKRRS